MGSSPQVRGRFGLHPGDARVAGLIPAGAGQMTVIDPVAEDSTAHPRRCGADVATYIVVWSCPGSSPQVRGRFDFLGRRRVPGGLIPAGAGQMRVGPVVVDHSTAHPRRCGADSSSVASPTRANGSSPQVRGRSRFVSFLLSSFGLIPAGAGQIMLVLFPPIALEGSSPQVRGRFRVACNQGLH